MLSGVSSFAKEMNFTASTPANREVRDFLMISQGDSIDFIRWKLKIVNLKEFDLSCSYGISKPNTNGFIDEKKVQIKGIVNFSDRTLTLNHHDKSLSMQVLNNNIVHLLNKDGSMMVGNGGWSYTLNSIKPVPDGELKFKSKNAIFKDSIVFEGRTPCRGIEELTEGRTRPECYKKKWLIYLYKSSPSASSGTFLMAIATESIDGDIPGNTGDMDTWIVKLNSDGSKDWIKSYSGPGRDACQALVLTDDGFFMAGSTESNSGIMQGSHGLWDGFVIKVKIQ